MKILLVTSNSTSMCRHTKILFATHTEVSVSILKKIIETTWMFKNNTYTCLIFIGISVFIDMYIYLTIYWSQCDGLSFNAWPLIRYARHIKMPPLHKSWLTRQHQMTFTLKSFLVFQLYMEQEFNREPMMSGSRSA